ncbi:MAG TPA: tetratricopeptide repeat protein [Candidatus Baltobacteraceae bacterium]
MLLHAQGRFEEAAAAFREGIAAQPDLAELHVNLAQALTAGGDFDGAAGEYQLALKADPSYAPALNGIGTLHVRAGRFAQARECFERVLAGDSRDLTAHAAMYELEQIDNNVPKALYHQRRILERKTLFSEFAPQERRRLLALLVPGDWQANVPVDFLIDRRTTTLHKFYLLSPQQSGAAPMPQADAVFVAIGESDEAVEALSLASALLKRIGLPYINDPHKILATNRVQVARNLAGIANVHVPPTSRVRRQQLESAPLEFPVVLRPVGSQAGHQLARIADAHELATYLQKVAAEAFYTMPFVDFRSPDGYYRKYRIVIVDKQPYPYHLAISPNWMIHYYNAPMRETAWMRDEEAAFLAEFDRVFPAPLQRALREVAQAIGLDYFGIDCSIDPQGRLLIFEADPAMIVHAGDEPHLFAYKQPYVQRIFAAFEALIDRARSR